MPISKRVRLRLGSVQHLKSKFGDGYTLQFRVPAHRAAGPGAHVRVRLIQNWFCGGVGAIRGPSFFPLYNLNFHIVSFFRRMFADYTVVSDRGTPCPGTEVPKSQLVRMPTFSPLPPPHAPLGGTPRAPGRPLADHRPPGGRLRSAPITEKTPRDVRNHWKNIKSENINNVIHVSVWNSDSNPSAPSFPVFFLDIFFLFFICFHAAPPPGTPSYLPRGGGRAEAVPSPGGGW